MRILYLMVAFTCLGNPVASGQMCSPPTNLYTSDLSSCGFTVHWKSSDNVIKYGLSYRLSASTQWIKQINSITDTFYHLSGLQPLTPYVVQVVAFCSNSDKSKPAKTTVSTRRCTLPQSVSITDVDSSSAKLIVLSTCNFDSLHVRYRSLYGSPQEISFPASSFYLIDGLNNDSTFLFQISTCPLDSNEWTATAIDTFKIDVVSSPVPLHNILIILLDDARYDYYSCNGAPSFLHTPNIDRIANEGVNFKKAFVVTSLCVPSRSAIATGLFPTRTGVQVNKDHLDTSFMTIPKFLKNHGYYTALVGKNHNTYLEGSIPEFNFYMVVDAYNNPIRETTYNYNGTTIQINKRQTLTLTDTAIALIKRVNQPFFIQLAYHDPHFEPEPLSSFLGRFGDEIIFWKPDTAKYTVNYPSFLYDTQNSLIHGIDLDTTYRHVLEAVAGTDSCIGKVLEALESTGKLDSTLIIFLSDNGHMMGSHWLSGKTKAYDPSMRVPLFMRYPKWFAASSVVQDQLALNLDIAPTIYNFVKLPYSDKLDGLSLKKMYDGKVSRREFYYGMLRDDANVPSNRAVRDFYFKYIYYSCNSDTVEELFDMMNDSLEMNNLVNNHKYDSILAVYRLKLDSMKIAWDDTVPSQIKTCYIADPYHEREMQHEEEEDFDSPAIYPSLTTGELEIYNPWPIVEIELFDYYGRRLDVFETSDLYLTLSLPDLPGGLYVLRMTYQEKSFIQKIILQH